MDILIIFGTIFVGQKLLLKIVGHTNVIISLGLGMVLISQTLYILILIKASLTIIYLTSVIITICGIWYLLMNINLVRVLIQNFKVRMLALDLDPVYILAILLIVAYLLLSLAPPTNSDGLHYHWGIPLYILSNLELPPTNLWLHGSQGGVGEVFNILGMIFHAVNLGTILQSFSLVAFSLYLANKYNYSKKNFLLLFILSSPVLIFLVSTPKYQLFPGVLTALGLFLTVSEKEINKKTFFIICCLLMGAAQQRISFLLTGGIVGSWAFWKASRDRNLIIAIGLMCFLFFLLPKFIWNFNQSPNTDLISFISPLPLEYLDFLHTYRENNSWFPLNLFVPDNFGKVTTVIGFQILILFMVRTNSKKFWEAITLTFIGILTIYIFGMSVGRAFYEFVLWTAVAFSFLPEKDFKFRLYNRYLFVQGLFVLGGVAYGVFNLLPGVLSEEKRQEVMHSYAWEYSAVSWANEVLPDKSTVISGLRSVSLFSNDFIPTDWLTFFPYNTSFYEAISSKKPKFLVAEKRDKKISLFGVCVGEIYAGPKSFKEATRNPYNKGKNYSVVIYHFDSSLLNICKP